MIRAVKGESEFSTTNHLKAVKEERSNVRKTWNDVNESKLEGIIYSLELFDHSLFIRAKQMGS